MAREDEQRLKDLLRNIETGDIPEDLPDPEEYDDMGGIKSLDRGAPSIKMASETPEEEFELEMFMMLQEFEDAKKNGYGGSLEDFSREYFSKRKMKTDQDRQMAMYGGRMQYAGGTDLRNKMSKLMIKVANGTITDKEMIELRNMESAGMFSRANNAYGGRMQYAEAGRAYEEVIDKDAEEEYYKAKAEQLDRKYNPQNYPESERNLSLEQIKKMLKKQEEEKAKRAKGGIAGVL